MTSQEQAQSWIDYMADSGAIGHYKKRTVVQYLAKLLERVKQEERSRMCCWLDDWDERRKGFTSEQADALGDAAEALRGGMHLESALRQSDPHGEK